MNDGSILTGGVSAFGKFLVLSSEHKKYQISGKIKNGVFAERFGIVFYPAELVVNSYPNKAFSVTWR